jgi:hypothetical protein
MCRLVSDKGASIPRFTLYAHRIIALCRLCDAPVELGTSDESTDDRSDI